jgi:hypothetical protein
VSRIVKLAENELAPRGRPYLMSLGGANQVNMIGLLALGGAAQAPCDLWAA